MAGKEPTLQFVATDWVQVIKRWSGTWVCPKTGEVGSTIYFPDDGSSFNLEASDGVGELVVIKGDRNAPPDPNKVTLMFRLYGGRDAFAKHPEEAYLNLNQDYDGPRLMTVPDYESACATRKIPVTQVATALDAYLASRA
mgnify:CR=1 FL=1